MTSLPGDVPPPRLLLPTGRADLRATWHTDRGALVVSLWHDMSCAASAPLSITDSARLAGFLVDHLAARAVAAEADDAGVADAEAGDKPEVDLEGKPAAGVGHPGAAPVSASPEQNVTAPIELSRERHLRPAPEPGTAQRAGAAVDEAIAAGGEALTAAVDAARRAWRARLG